MVVRTHPTLMCIVYRSCEIKQLKNEWTSSESFAVLIPEKRHFFFFHWLGSGAEHPNYQASCLQSAKVCEKSVVDILPRLLVNEVLTRDWHWQQSLVLCWGGCGREFKDRGWGDGCNA